MYTERDHTFAICAYKENPYLEEAIESIEHQTVVGEVLLSTSTPNAYVRDICERHKIRMVVNPHPHLAGDDWNYAYDQATTPLVTIVHQDDFYCPDYLARILAHLNGRAERDALILYTDYFEMRGKERVYDNRLLRVKRRMNAPFTGGWASRSKWLRRRMLGFGDPICCPSITYVKTNCGKSIFNTTLVNSCDYMTFVRLSSLDGAFVYIPEPLMGHRIYAGSATTANLEKDIRRGEDEQIMEELWPAPLARLINRRYATSEKSNVLD